MAIGISQTDITEAEDFLVAYLTEAVPEADFTEGSAVRDLCVTSIAHVFAFLRKELRSVRARQSLRSLAELPEDEDVDDAVDAILSNFFITRKEGLAAEVVARLYFSARVGVSLTQQNTFVLTDGTVFRVASPEAVSISADELQMNQVGLEEAEYSCEVLLRCDTSGTSGNIPPSRFQTVLGLGSYFKYADTVGSAYGGTERETTAQLLERAPLALSTRDYVNARSIKNALLDRVPAVSEVTVVGTGDPEMQRDLLSTWNTRFKYHVGGKVDVYVKLPRTRATATLTVGGAYPRPDNGIALLRDSTVNFVTSGVVKNNVIKITDGLGVSEDLTFVVADVTPTALTVSPGTPFPSDTYASGTFVTYSVGRTGPDYDERIKTRSTGQTTQIIAQSGAVVMPAGPVYQIHSLEYVDAQGAAVTYTTRTNGEAFSVGQFQVVVPDYSEAQSNTCAVVVKVPTIPDGTQVKVTYDTVVDYALVRGLLDDPLERTIATDQLARVHHPIYVSFYTTYAVRDGYEDPGATFVSQRAREFVESALAGQLAMGDIISELSRTFSGITRITPVIVEYELLAPDGQVLQYKTTDHVTVTPTYGSGATLINSGTLRTVGTENWAEVLKNSQEPYSAEEYQQNPSPRAKSDVLLAAYLRSQGVSDRTTRYLAKNITVEMF